MRNLLCWLIAAAALALPPSAGAQPRSVTVGVPTGALTQLVQDLAPAFQARTGIAVSTVPSRPEPAAEASGADALLVPGRSAPDGLEQQVVLYGEGILVGSRADRARVKGLRDIRKALQWIASARGLFVSSSPALGLRELELTLWQEIGVNVRTRLTWYTEVAGDEAAVFDRAALLGSYVMVQRATWAAQQDRRGLEVLVQGDPLLRTAFVSAVARPGSDEAQAWHEWLLSEEGQRAVAEWSLNGLSAFTPARPPGGPASAQPRT